MVSGEEPRCRIFLESERLFWLTGSVAFTGWDPIFEYEGKTYAEMDKAEKVGRSLFGPALFLIASSATLYRADTDLVEIL